MPHHVDELLDSIVPADAFPRGHLYRILVYPDRASWSVLVTCEGSGFMLAENVEKRDALVAAVRFLAQHNAELDVRNAGPFDGSGGTPPVSW